VIVCEGARNGGIQARASIGEEAADCPFIASEAPQVSELNRKESLSVVCLIGTVWGNP
jgi:hypothetical protein